MSAGKGEQAGALKGVEMAVPESRWLWRYAVQQAEAARWSAAPAGPSRLTSHAQRSQAHMQAPELHALYNTTLRQI
jgi:hypothetical protein